MRNLVTNARVLTTNKAQNIVTAATVERRAIRQQAKNSSIFQRTTLQISWAANG